MKNTFKLFGIIALLAVIAFSMVACGEEDQNSEKTIKVTGIPAEYIKATFEINLAPAGIGGGGVVASGSGQLSGSTATFDLYYVNDSNDSIRWTGKGTWGVWLGIDEKWGFVDKNITNAVTTIPFSDFTLFW